MKKIILLVLILSLLVLEVNSQISKSVIKNYFLTGSKPTQSNFSNLIDNCYNQVTDGILKGTSYPTITYNPYNVKVQGKLYTGTETPSSTDRLNYDGYFYATKVYNADGEITGGGTITFPILGENQNNYLKLSSNNTHINSGLIDLYGDNSYSQNLLNIQVNSNSHGISINNSYNGGYGNSCISIGVTGLGKGIIMTNNSSSTENSIEINHYGSSGTAVSINTPNGVKPLEIINGSFKCTIFNPITSNISNAVAYKFGIFNDLTNSTALHTKWTNSSDIELMSLDNDGRIKTTYLNTATRTPSSSSDTGVTGDIAWDSNYIYICISTNTWKRVAISTW